MHPIPKIPKGHKVNFQTMLDAAGLDSLALMMLYDQEEGRFRPVVCMMGRDEENNYYPTPVAILIEDDPYARFEDPTQEFPDADTILEKE